MISAKTLINHSNSALKRYVHKDPMEGPVCFQLSGNDSEELGRAVRVATDFGADLIDLNCGCPVRKIRGKGAGSSLLMHPAKIYSLITAMKANTHVPVSVKIRVDNESDKQNSEIVKAVSDAGADYLIVHGRHWTEDYDVTCRYDSIEYFVNEMKIPVIGNGDIDSHETLMKMYATGCAGVMIGRAGVGQPWLIGKLMAQMQNHHYQSPQCSEIGNVFIEHVHKLYELIRSEKFTVLQSRKVAKYYARGYDWQYAFTLDMNHCHSLAELEQVTRQYFK
jgi:tRNA-dihydrouridine synthase B